MKAGGAACAMTVGAIAAWVGYAWLPHLAVRGRVRRGPSSSPRIALTFDDGPDAQWTPRVLDILAAHRVQATFFLIGERARRLSGIVRAIAAAGHEIGNHSWSHPSLWLCGPARTRFEVRHAHAALADLAGEAPRFFRPPWGMVNAALPAALRDCEERAVLWSIQPEGLIPAGPARQVERVLRRADAGAIVDLHDAEGLAGAPARMVAALPDAIAGLRAAGYGFATVGQLLAGPT
jgi:peptidoglycan/xylan/chitin deacetylase (PgdA/CDA1 family)